MLTSILNRLQKLESERGSHAPPTFDQFKSEWETFDELSKALFLAEASNAGNVEALHPDAMSRSYFQTISRYLHEMGLVVEAEKSILDIAKEMDSASE